MEESLNPEILKKLVQTKMPFGKYKDRFLLDIPEPYVVWMVRNELPAGELGRMIGLLYEIKRNGLEEILRPLRGLKNPRNF